MNGVVWVVLINGFIHEVYEDDRRAKANAWDLKQRDPESEITISRWTVL
jgi:hypothetical protein